MKIVGLTGGIGSGKSTVARMFVELNIPVYIADEQAKKLMNTNLEIKKSILKLLGSDAYFDNGILNRAFIAKKVFKDKKLLQSLNNIAHPAVAKHFLSWTGKQRTSYVIKEAAILFENGGYKLCDKVILVTAPKEIRLQRVQQRDNITEKQVTERMQFQWEDQKKISLADYVINNEDLEETSIQVQKIHNKLIKF